MATSEGATIVGTFRDPQGTKQAVTQLAQAGFSQEQIELNEETASRTMVRVRAGAQYQEAMRILQSNGASNVHMQVTSTTQVKKNLDDHGPYIVTMHRGTHR